MIASVPGNDRPRQPIRSYVLRGGRITRAQRRALDELWPQWGLPFTPGPLDLDAVFGRYRPRVLEIGFGDGATLIELARMRPDTDFLGVEVHQPGIGHCLLAIEAGGLTNIRLIAHDAVEVLEKQLTPDSLDDVLLYFPDPWPKKRHHKRRLFTGQFVTAAVNGLLPGGQMHVVSDVKEYFQIIEPLLQQCSQLQLADFQPQETAGLGEWVGTNFERKYLAEGRTIYSCSARKITGHQR